MRVPRLASVISFTVLTVIPACLLCGCASMPERTEAVPVPESGQVYQLDSVSVRSPEGPDWVQFQETGKGLKQLVYLKKGASPSNHYMADVSELEVSPDVDSLEEIKTHVTARLFEEFAPGRRYKVEHEEYVPSRRYGAAGYDYAARIRDYEAPNMGDAEYLSEVMFGHLFRHPDVPGLFVVIGYQERGHAEELDADAEARANAFFDGLQIKP